MRFTAEALRALPREHDRFVGVDSDGCVFDSMRAKQVECFHPAFLDAWELHDVASPVRACLEFTNLYGATRGGDRFLNFHRAVELMREHPDLQEVHDRLPDTVDLARWLAAGGPFGEARLEDALSGRGDAELTGSRGLQRVLDWSRDTDRRVRSLGLMTAFEGARRFLAHAADRADLVVISSTPLAALETEWRESGLGSHVRFIASKDIGSKPGQLDAAMRGKGYREGLLIGDAPGDLEAARQAGVGFHPILPGEEEVSWRELIEFFPRWLAGREGPEGREKRIERFCRHLPDRPAWA